MTDQKENYLDQFIEHGCFESSFKLSKMPKNKSVFSHRNGSVQTEQGEIRNIKTSFESLISYPGSTANKTHYFKSP